MSVVEFIFRKATEVTSSSELKIDTTLQFLCKQLKSSEQLFHGHATSYNVMSWCVLLITRVFNQFFFRWRHRGMTSDRFFKNILSGSGSFLKNYIFLNWGSMIYTYLYTRGYLWVKFLICQPPVLTDNFALFLFFLYQKIFYDLCDIY